MPSMQDMVAILEQRENMAGVLVVALEGNVQLPPRERKSIFSKVSVLGRSPHLS